MAMLRARIVQDLGIKFDPGVRLETVGLFARADSQCSVDPAPPQ